MNNIKNLIVKFNYLINNSSFKLFNLNNLLNVISIVLIGVCVYFIMDDLKSINNIVLIISSIISFLINIFISNKFTLSDNKFIKHLQKFIFFNIIFLGFFFLSGFFLIMDSHVINTSHTNINKETVMSSSLLGLIKNKIPFWLREMIIIIISLITFIYFSNKLPINAHNIITNYIYYVKIFFIIGIFSTSIMIFRYVLTLYLIYQFSENNIKSSIYLPSFILRWIKNIERISQLSTENKTNYIEFYYRILFMYVFILLLIVLT